MHLGRHIALLRSATLVGLTASTLLSVETLRPGRSFCPLEEACAQARHSPLGSLFGVPTALVGMVAFGAFLLLSLMRLEGARRVLRPAGVLALAAGAGLVTYQALALSAFCPLCLVADGAGLAIGVLAFTWPRLPVRISGRPLPPEPRSVAAAWTLAAALALVTPFAWPREMEAGWVELPEEAALEAEALAPPLQSTALAAETPAQDPEGAVAVGPATTPAEAPSPTPAERAPADGPEDRAPAATAAAEAVAAWIVRAPTEEEAPPTVGAVPVPPHEAPAAPVPRRAQGPVVVEYVNAFCTHCRATHRRLEEVLARTDAPVRRQRVYTWNGAGWPPWARACAFAASVGQEDRMFAELLSARYDRVDEVRAAGARAGLDLEALERALRDPAPPPRLVQDRRRVQAARLRALPTLDIGRRRLMGEQTHAELRAALTVALRADAGTP